MISTSKQVLTFAVILLVLTGFRGHDDRFPKDYFRSPLGIPLMMAGNFAEMRANHFHSGLDLKTENREGLPVYAAADGWVSRVKVSPYGYGNVLYVAHPNGYTTVYAHLKSFSDPVASYVKGRQYASNRFDVDKYLPEGKYPVKKGDVIALSGNSGSSSGPHLHFEIRNSSSQKPLNPLLFGLEVNDSVPPKIFRIKVYPQSETGFVEVVRKGDSTPLVATRDQPLVLDAVAVAGSNGKYQLADVDALRAHGRLGFGVQVHDYQEGSPNRLGAFTIELRQDGEQLFESELAEFTFGQTRYINAHVDYGEYTSNRRWIQRSHKLPGNALDIYRGKNDGYLDAEAGQLYELEYVVSDVAGNRSELAFKVAGVENNSTRVAKRPDPAYRIVRSEGKTIAGDKMRVHFSAGTFYEDINLVYRVEDRLPTSYSSVYALHEESTPLHKAMTLSIQADLLPSELRPRALLATVGDDGKLSSAGGSYTDGYVVAKPRSFGRYTIAVDTTAPVITPYRFPKDGQFRKGQSIEYKISDDFSGVQSYAGFVDSNWVLFEYDAKKNLISYTIDDVVPSGTHKLVIRVEDGKGNVSTVSRSITVAP